MSDRDAVLFVNEAFYVSLAGADADGMDALWAREVEVTCIHPGWEALRGREAVMDSWRAIMRAGAPDIRCREPSAALYGEIASVICYEEMQGGYLIATNLFVREDDGWRMVHHQAGPTRGTPAPEHEGEEKPSIN